MMIVLALDLKMFIIIFLLGYLAALDKNRRRLIRAAIFYSMWFRWLLQFNCFSIITPKYLVESSGLMIVSSTLTDTGFLYFFLGWTLKCINSVFVGCNFSFHDLHQHWNSSMDCFSLEVRLDIVWDDVHRAVSSTNRPCSVWFGIPFIESSVYVMYNNGDKGDPCRVLLFNLNGLDRMFSISIAAVLFCRNEIE